MAACMAALTHPHGCTHGCIHASGDSNTGLGKQASRPTGLGWVHPPNVMGRLPGVFLYVCTYSGWSAPGWLMNTSYSPVSITNSCSPAGRHRPRSAEHVVGEGKMGGVRSQSLETHPPVSPCPPACLSPCRPPVAPAV
eukprot:353314-Chlamydomonas_euryale.AAC.2